MLIVEFDIVGSSPIVFSKPIEQKKETNEAHDDFEKQIWRERLHYDTNGQVYIPPEAIKATLDNVAKFLAETVPGKGKATYTKHFKSGLLITEPFMLGVKKDDVPGMWKFVSSKGKGGGTRVWRCYPTLDKWEVHGSIIVLDPILIAKPEKIEEYLSLAGKFIGLLAFAPRAGGIFGRFTIKNFKTGKLKKSA